MASIQPYTLKDGSKRYRVRWTAASSKKRSKSFRLKKDADRFALENERQEALGRLYQAPPETFADVLAAWLERYRSRVRPSTHARRKEALGPLSSFKPMTVDRITAAAVEDEILSTATKAPRQAQIALQTMKLALRDAKLRGQVVDERIFEIKPPRLEPRERRFLAWDEVDELATNTPEPYGNLVRFAALTGLRQGELFGLTDKDLDLDGGKIRVERGVYRGELVPLKTRASRRSVDLTPTAVLILRRQLLARTPNPEGLVFPSSTGAIIDDDNFRHRIFKPACVRAGLRGLAFHDLRHTYAALMVDAGAHPKYLQAQMGHSSVRTTLDQYGHLFPDANRAVLKGLEALVAGTRDHRTALV
jgi:integrase